MEYANGGSCWNCGKQLGPLDFGRSDRCPQCGRDTRVCKGCEMYERGSQNDCREPQADPVGDKERSNFCDYFKPKSGIGGGAASRDSLKAAAEALFKKKT